MSLHIYYDENTVPNGMEIIRCNDAYFNMHVKLEDTEEVTHLLKDIDDAVYCSDITIKSNKHPTHGELYSECLSTGCKSALNTILFSDKNNVCISSDEMGNNAWNALLTCTSGNILYKCTSIVIDRKMSCDIVFEGIHCSSIEQYVKVVKEYEDNL